jgi:hypothetical protein
MNQSHLVDAVKIAVANENKSANFDAAVIEAMRLADLFEHIKPVDYVLPLDAMAGLPSPAFRA